MQHDENDLLRYQERPIELTHAVVFLCGHVYCVPREQVSDGDMLLKDRVNASLLYYLELVQQQGERDPQEIIRRAELRRDKKSAKGAWFMGGVFG